MSKYYIGIEIQKGKLEEIFDRIDKAREEIYKGYCDLQELGVLKIAEVEESTSANDVN